MALIKCCECATEVSEYADKCPKCGCPVAISLEKNAASVIEAQQKIAEQAKLDAEKVAAAQQKKTERNEKIKANKKKIILISCLLVVLLCIVGACAVCYVVSIYNGSLSASFG